MDTTLRIRIVVGISCSLVIGIIIGNVWATKKAFKQMVFQQAHNDMIREFTESLKWKGVDNEDS